MNNCDLAIVTLADGMYGLGVPSKSYNIMAAGKPILFIGDANSEIALTIKDFDIGYCYEANDVIGLKSFLSSLNENRKEELREKGLRAREVSEKYYSEKIVLQKFNRAIN